VILTLNLVFGGLGLCSHFFFFSFCGDGDGGGELKGFFTGSGIEQ
jgi:hypothetical protein